MHFHKRILEWQVAHPNLTMAFWGIIWVIVLAVVFRRTSRYMRA